MSLSSETGGMQPTRETEHQKHRPYWRLQLGVLFFLLIAIHRYPILFWPPYTEQTLVWTEADWLYHNDFDFQSLREDEIHFEDGGPRVYWCTIVSPAIALLMHVVPNSMVLIVLYRLAVWAATAFILVVVYALMREISGVFVASLIVAATYLTPLFGVQVEMLGMDTMMTASAMLWWYVMHRRHFLIATLLSIIPFFIKPSAFIVPQAAAAYLFLLACTYLQDRAYKRSLWAFLLVGLNVVIFSGQMYLLVFGGNLHGRMMIFSDLQLWLDSSPDLIVLTFTTALLSVLYLFRTLHSDPPPESETPSTGRLKRWGRFISAEPLLISGWVVILLNLFAATLTYYESRHLTLVVPFLTVLFGRTGMMLGRPSQLFPIAALLLVGFQACNQYGRFYPVLEGPVARGWGVLERSLEYRADMLSNMKATSIVESAAKDDAVLAFEPFIYTLKRPQLGYVQQGFIEPEDAFNYAARDHRILRIVKDRPRSVIITYIRSQLGEWPFPAYHLPLPESGDEILYQDDLVPPTIVYRRRFPPVANKADDIRRFVDLLFSNSKHVDPAVRLAIVGDLEMARQFIAAESGIPNSDDTTRPELIRRIKEFRDDLSAKLKDLPDNFFVRRQLDTVNHRILALETGAPLQPLPWSERTLLDTWVQRLQYFPPRSLRASSE